MMLHRNAFQTTSRGDGSRSSTTHDPNKNRISKENKDATYFYFSKNNNYYYDSNDDKSVKSVHDKYDCINNVFTSSSSFTLLKSFDTLSNKKAAFQSAVSSSSSPVLLACSVSSVRKEHEDLFTWRKLCQDRKGWVDHLHPDKFIMNSSLSISSYFTEQLKLEVERDEKVNKGLLTTFQAELESDEWAEREWKIRMEALPNRIAIAFAKYHAITIVMRLYEYIASTYVNEKTLDKLTLDTSDCARRTVREVGPSNGTEIVQSMFTSCLHANFISYLADYSVHQVILLYGYYIYVQKQRSNIRNRRQDSTDGGSTAINDTSNNTGIAIVNGSIVLSFCKKSILLLIQRSFGLVTSSCFGAIGSYVLGVRPGFGTMCGLNLGDTIANTVTESLLSDIPT